MTLCQLCCCCWFYLFLVNSNIKYDQKKAYLVISTIFCKFNNFDSSNCSRWTASWIYWFKRYNSSDVTLPELAPTTVDCPAFVSRPSGKNNFNVATIQPWVSFLDEFSVTSTPNCTISPELTSNASDCAFPWLKRWLFINVPLLLPVSFI